MAVPSVSDLLKTNLSADPKLKIRAEKEKIKMDKKAELEKAKMNEEKEEK